MSPALRSILGEIVKWGGMGLFLLFFVVFFEPLKAVTVETVAKDGGALPRHGYAFTPSSGSRYRSSAQTTAPAVSTGPTVMLDARSDGHFYAPVRLNGREIEAVVDTGATSVALSYEDAMAAGIYVGEADFTLKTLTANGVARAAPVMIDRIELDGITVRDVRATVAEPGRLHITLLGMSFLGKLARFEMRGRSLILHN